MIYLSIFIMYQNPLLFSFFIYEIVFVEFHVGVNDGDEFSLVVSQRLKHLLWIRKLLLVPLEVPLAIAVFNVQPDRIAGNVVFTHFI